jgi:predicted metal-dependent hydrolase
MFKDKTVYELKTICMMYNIEYPSGAKKAEILKAIQASGTTIEKYEKDLETQVSSTDAVEEIKEVIVIEKEKVKTTKQDFMLLKMVHPRGALNVGNGVVFTIDQPFKSISREKANDILARAKDEVREATPEEVAGFYGVKL